MAVFVTALAWTGSQVLGDPGGASAPALSTSGASEADSDDAGQAGTGAAATGRAFLEAWQAGRFEAMQQLVVDPADDMERVYGGLRRSLGLRKVVVTPGALDAAGTSLPYRAVLTLGRHSYAYDGAVPLRQTAAGWRVAFTSATLHPALHNGERLRLKTSAAPTRLLDRRGRDLATDADLSQNLLGEQGVSGLRRVVASSAGLGPTRLVVEDASTGAVLSQLARWPGRAGAGVRTTIDLTVQKAAERAVGAARARAALVAIDVPTGEVLALANDPVEGTPATLEPAVPGSTFKIVTAAAALAHGASPAMRIECPASVVIGGRTIRNHERADLGAVSLTRAFAQSCNTAFATLGSRLPPGALEAAAEQFGFGAGDLLPVASESGSLPPPDSTARLVEDSIGQGQVTASPLQMASVAAAVAAGTWRQPHVLPCPKCATHLVPHAAELRTLMRAVVTSGTGRSADLPGRAVHGKTGTAEYGVGEPLPTHAWFVGWQGRTAFAVYVEDGTSGGSVAAPLAARFLRILGSR